MILTALVRVHSISIRQDSSVPKPYGSWWQPSSSHTSHYSHLHGPTEALCIVEYLGIHHSNNYILKVATQFWLEITNQVLTLHNTWVDPLQCQVLEYTIGLLKYMSEFLTLATLKAMIQGRGTQHHMTAQYQCERSVREYRRGGMLCLQG